ncbi:MAG: hypothetical protein ACHP84_18265 [Caulobacterales bacterium]|jgi:hypothetical protein
MITYNVVKETHGWAIRVGEHMCTPYWSRDCAIDQALRLADTLRGHGQAAQVVVEGLS